MKDIYLKLVEKLKTLEGIRWIDADEGQLEFWTEKPAVLFPCVLIDIDYPKCKDLATTIQDVDVQINLKFGFEPMGQTNAAAPATVQANALKRFDTMKAAFDLLQGWEDVGFTPLSRNYERTDKGRDDNLKVINQGWTTNFEEERKQV